MWRTGRRANESRKCALTRGSRGNNTESRDWPSRQATDSLCLPGSNLSSRPEAENYAHPTGKLSHMRRFSPLLQGASEQRGACFSSRTTCHSAPVLCGAEAPRCAQAYKWPGPWSTRPGCPEKLVFFFFTTTFHSRKLVSSFSVTLYQNIMQN